MASKPRDDARDRRLALKCPDCKRIAGYLEATNVATQVVRRTCRHCGQGWQIIHRPLSATKDIAVDQAEWMRV